MFFAGFGAFAESGAFGFLGEAPEREDVGLAVWEGQARGVSDVGGRAGLRSSDYAQRT